MINEIEENTMQAFTQDKTQNVINILTELTNTNEATIAALTADAKVLTYDELVQLSTECAIVIRDVHAFLQAAVEKAIDDDVAITFIGMALVKAGLV